MCAGALEPGDVEHRVWVIGTDDDAEAVGGFGAYVRGVIPKAGVVTRSLRRLARDEDRALGEPDAVVCWDGASLLRSAELYPDIRPRVLWHCDRAPEGVLARGRGLDLVRAVPSFVFDEGLRARLGEMGARDVRLLRAPEFPGRQSARAPARGDGLTLGLLGDPPAAVDAVGFARVLGLVATALPGERVRGLLARGVRGEGRAVRFVRSLECGCSIETVCGTAELASRVDAWVAPAGGCGSVVRRWAHASGRVFVLGGGQERAVSAAVVGWFVGDRVAECPGAACEPGSFSESLRALVGEMAQVPRLVEGLPRPVALRALSGGV